MTEYVYWLLKSEIKFYDTNRYKEELFWRLKDAADRAEHRRRRSRALRSAESQEAAATRTKWRRNLRRWRQKMDDDQNAMNEFEAARVKNAIAAEKDRVEEVSAAEAVRVEERTRVMAAYKALSRRVDQRCLRLLQSFAKESGEYTDREMQSVLSSLIEQKQLELRVLNAEADRAEAAHVAELQRATKAAAVERARVEAQEAASAALAADIAATTARKVAVAEQEEHMRVVRTEATESGRQQRMAPELLKRAAALEGEWRDEVVAAADSGDAVFVDGALVGTVADGASPNLHEPWRAVWSKEAKSIKAWQRAEEATRAMVTKEAAAASASRAAAEAQRRYTERQAEAANAAANAEEEACNVKSAADVERWARRQQAMAEETRVADWQTEQYKVAVAARSRLREAAHGLVKELTVLAETGANIGVTTLPLAELGLEDPNEYLATAEALRKRGGADAFDTPLAYLLGGDIGTIRRISRKGSEADLEISSGFMPLSMAEVDGFKIDDLIETVKRDNNLASGNTLLGLLPPEAKEFLLSEEFVEDCMRQFRELDGDGNGVLTADELFPIMCSLTNGSPWAITLDHCERFANVFDDDGNGVISIDEFVGFCRFLSLASWLSKEDMDVLAEIAEEDAELGLAPAAGDETGDDTLHAEAHEIDRLIAAIKEDKSAIESNLHRLPDKVMDQLCSEEFAVQALAKFDECDKDDNGVLTPDELFPVIEELMGFAESWAITMDHCIRFATVFDDDGNGVITQDEFLGFCQTSALISYLESGGATKEEEEQAAAAAAAAAESVIWEDKARLETMIETIKTDKLNSALVVDEVLAQLNVTGTNALATLVNSAEFEQSLLAKFDELNSDGSGVIDADELFTPLQELSVGTKWAVDEEQTVDLVVHFESESSGVIARAEVLTFFKYVYTLAYLQALLNAGDLSEGAGAAEAESDLLIWQDVERVQKVVNQLMAPAKDHQAKASLIASLMSQVPPPLADALLGAEFSDNTLAAFSKKVPFLPDPASSATTSILCRPEAHLAPVVASLTAGQPWAVAEAQCVALAGTYFGGALNTGKKATAKLRPKLAKGMKVEARFEGKKRYYPARIKQVRKNGTCDVDYDDGEMEKKVSPDLIRVPPNSIKVSPEEAKFGVTVVSPADFLGLAHFTVLTDYLLKILQTDAPSSAPPSSAVATPGSGEEAVDKAALARDAARVSKMITDMQQDKAMVDTIIPQLPDDVRLQLASDEFAAACGTSFDNLNVSGSEALGPDELVPIIVSMSEGHPWAIEQEHCAKFAALFDDDKNGVISRTEFAKLCRFVAVMRYLDTLAEQANMPPMSPMNDPMPPRFATPTPPNVPGGADGPDAAPSGAPIDPSHPLALANWQLDEAALAEGNVAALVEALDQIVSGLALSPTVELEDTLMGALPHQVRAALTRPEFSTACEGLYVTDADPENLGMVLLEECEWPLEFLR